MARNTWVSLENTDPQGLSVSGVAKNTFTAAGVIFPALSLPANYWKVGKLVHLKARGIWAATGTPTYTFSVTANAVTVVTSAAITVSALTNQAWELEVQMQCRTEGTSGTLFGMGDLAMGGVTGVNYLPATGTAPAATSAIPTDAASTLSLQVACSVSSVSNAIQGHILEIRALN